MKYKKLSAFTAIAASAALILSACSDSGDSGNNNGAGGGTGGNGGDTNKPLEISWMAILHTATTPTPNGPVETKLQEITGADITYQWIPAANASERMSASIASNTLTEVVSLQDLQNATIRSALDSGMFWDVEPYLSQFENLKEIPESTIESAKLNGKLYGVPFQKVVARYGVHVRQDWLDNLGLEVPRTIDELTEVARAFTEDDPDGNGIDDTVGFYDRAESFNLGFRSLAGYFGAGNYFEVNDDDEIVASFATEPFFEAMEWYKDVYDNGWSNQEFVTMQKQNQTDGIIQGKGGIVISGLFEARGYVETAKSADPNTPMEWALINDMVYKDVPRRIISDTRGGVGGIAAIPRDVVKTEEELLAILGVIDKMMTPEGFELMTHGIEGIHFERDADGVVNTTDQTKWEQEVQPYSSSRPSEIVVFDKSTNDYVNLANELMAENQEYAIINPTQSLNSETYDRQWSTLYQEVTDAYNKYIMGQIDLDGYKAVLDQVGNKGLNDILAEFTEGYQAVQAQS